MNTDAELYSALLRSFQLLCQLLRQPDGASGQPADFTKLQTLLQRDIPHMLGEYAPAEFNALYADFQAVYDVFWQASQYESLREKSVIVLGGRVHSGKSSFLNALLGRAMLPIDTTSAAAPVFVTGGETDAASGINQYGVKIPLEFLDIRRIAYGFSAMGVADGKPRANALTLGHALKSVLLSTPLQPYPNLAFFDLPGYVCPAEPEEREVQTDGGVDAPDKSDKPDTPDTQFPHAQMNLSNGILWFVPAETDGETQMLQEDLTRLQALRGNVPKLMIVSRADRRGVSELEALLSRLRATLRQSGLRGMEVHAFSCRPKQITDPALLRFLSEEWKHIRGRIADWNQAGNIPNYPRAFQALFTRCLDYCANALADRNRTLARLRASIQALRELPEAEQGEAERNALELLRRIAAGAQNSIGELNRTAARVQEVNRAFFTELNRVMGQMDGNPPELSRLDRTTDRNPVQMARQYLWESGIRSNPAMAELLQEAFAALRPLLHKYAGGSNYAAMLRETLAQRLDLSPGAVHLNDTLCNGARYQQLIAQRMRGM